VWEVIMEKSFTDERSVADVINGYEPKRYLEIGIFRCGTLSRVRSRLKVGVDPMPRVTFEEMSMLMQGDYALGEWTIIVPQASDEFFRGYEKSVPFDVVYVDGLHEYSQAMRDIRNGMDVLGDGGTLLLHDVIPTSEQMALDQGVGGDWQWTGDVWNMGWR
jgi:hypothetical protein